MESICDCDYYGNIEWRKKNGKLHRDNDLPAVEKKDGTKKWFKNGLLHRDGDLPAIEGIAGDKVWAKNGLFHRENDLPAIEYYNGNSKEWYKNGIKHREGGLPAMTLFDGRLHWYINGHKLTHEKGFAYMEFCKKMKNKNRERAQKKIYFWWIPICYDISKPCGQRMAQRNLERFDTMMKTSFQLETDVDIIFPFDQ